MKHYTQQEVNELVRDAIAEITEARLNPSDYYTQEDVNVMVARAIEHHGNANRFAKELGVSRQFIRHIKIEGRSPGQKVLDYLGLERVVRYVPKGG